MNIPMKACWRAEEVAGIVANEALEHHEAIFLATHSAIKGFDISGSHQGEIRSADESAVLETLSAPTRKHAFCVVQGEPGSGKSHLIRWLALKWPEDRDVTLLIQRADGSLEGALEQLKARLPAEFKPLFERLGRRQRATDEGRAKNFLSNLANALDPKYYDPPLEDVDWCAANLPGELIDNLTVKNEWTGPGRILRLLDGKGETEGSERNSQSAVFNLYDISALADAARSVRNSGVRPGAERLAAKIRDEADTIEAYRQEGWDDPEELLKAIGTKVPFSAKLLEALNRRRNDAVQHLLGVSAEGLKDLFREVRTVLAQRRQRLVLLLEDITSWEGIDNSLIDVLVTNADTRAVDGESDLCPLISVVGITPAYYADLPANYRGRITHELNLGLSKREGELQDVAALREEEARLEFAARYLSAARAGADTLAQWRELTREQSSPDAPNPCLNCHFKAGCHSTFGAVENVGLYPFTKQALGNLFDALNERDNGLTWKTPRGMLQAIISPVLEQAAAIEAGEFPTRRLESRALLPESRNLSGILEQMIEARLPLDGDRGQITRLVSYWGDRNRSSTVKLEDGTIAFAGVGKPIYDAFGVPWIGDIETEVKPAPAEVPVLQNEPPQARPPVVPDSDGERRNVSLNQTTASISRPVPPPSKRPTLTRSELQKSRDQLRHWKETGELLSPMEWNKLVYSLVQAIDPRSVSLDRDTFKRLFTESQVRLEGTAPSRRGYFWVSKDEWVLQGLEAYQALALDKGATSGEIETNRRALASMLRRLEPEIEKYANQRLGLVDGNRWDPSVSYAQILLARAWLRGTTTPDMPLPDQLRVILSDEDGAESDPATRSLQWREFLNKTNQQHKLLRAALREMLSIPQGESRSFGLADVSKIAGPLELFRVTLRFAPHPKDLESGVTLLEIAKEVISSVNGSLQNILRYERERLSSQADILLEVLRGYGLRDHIERLDKAISAVSTSVPGASPDLVRQWKAMLNRVAPMLDSDGVYVLQRFLSEINDLKGSGKVISLKVAAEAPSRDLAQFKDLASLGETVIGELLEHVRDKLKAKAGATSLADIHRMGGALVDLADGQKAAAI
ncbi:hypothetical protein HFO69_26225 [Rhizobium laguerreae]|uniref:hypothetical protein n=1 Tax=Rhizobium laguerreae TaxID=1076926 RepID=UPI001C91DDFF|nr:hypothetical protein [Rhizobium laguerreae]MBY3101167.1 hypothetical protein [Rhizobium laguerreae]